jgi:hypothetical protein
MVEVDAISDESNAYNSGSPNAYESSCFFLDLFFDPEVGGITFLRNEGKFLPDYMASHT